MNETPRIEAERIVTAWMESEDEPKSTLIDSVAHALTVCRTETLREAARLADDAIVLESEGHSLDTLAQMRMMKAKIADNIRAVASAVEGQALVQEFGPEHPLVVREHYHIDTFDHIAERVCVCDMKAATRVICAPCVKPPLAQELNARLLEAIRLNATLVDENRILCATGTTLRYCGKCNLRRYHTESGCEVCNIATANSGLFHRREERIVTLIAALKRAKEIIMELRGMGKAGSWDAYQDSPEMKQINAALESDAVEGHSDEEAVWARLLERADRNGRDR